MIFKWSHHFFISKNHSLISSLIGFTSKWSKIQHSIKFEKNQNNEKSLQKVKCFCNCWTKSLIKSKIDSLPSMQLSIDRNIISLTIMNFESRKNIFDEFKIWTRKINENKQQKMSHKCIEFDAFKLISNTNLFVEIITAIVSRENIIWWKKQSR